MNVEKDANLAREFEIAFPHELNKEQRERMLNDLCQELVKRHGVIVDAAIHAPHTQSGSDERNYHAHIMFTGRQIDLETGDFAKKRNQDFNKENSSQTVNQWRENLCRHYQSKSSTSRLFDRSRPPKLCRSGQRTTAEHSKRVAKGHTATQIKAAIPKST